MEIRAFTPDDLDDVRAYVEVENAAREVDTPWQHLLTEHEAIGQFRYGWDLEPPVPLLAVRDGHVVGVATWSITELDNLHLAWCQVSVPPDHRRQGVGSALVEALLQRTRDHGRTSLGAEGWDTPGTLAFAERHGFSRRTVAVPRRQVLADVDWDAVARLHADAREAAADYELVRRTGRSPDDELEPLAALTAAINDAPTDDLDVEDEVYTADRVRAYETAQLGRGVLLHRVLARHRTTGALAGHSVVAVDGERPHLAEQHDTAVAPEHRGHRLGLLLKAEMMLWLREAQPQLVSVDTWNAESNDHMIAVNETLGYRVLGRELGFQRDV